jgi:hypothetical protein
LSAYIATLFVLHGAIAWLAPIATDDWDLLVWSKFYRNAPLGDWAYQFIIRHPTLADLSNHAIAHHRWLHAVLTPMAGLAVVFGMFAIAMRRLPRFDSWDDVRLVVVLSALLWIAGPRIGLVFAHRPYASTWLYGTATALWLFVPFRCGWQPPKVLMVIGALLVGTVARPIGVFATVCIAIIAMKERRLWHWLMLVAAILGTAIGLVRGFFDFTGMGASLQSLYVPFGEASEVLAFMLGLAIVKIIVGVVWPQHRGDASPETSETLRWIAAWFGYVAVSLLGPRYSEAVAFPAAVLSCIAAIQLVPWLMGSRPIRRVLLALAIGINLIAWTLAVSKSLPQYAAYRERIAAIKAAPRGTTVTVPPYRQIRPSFFVYGEDLQDASRRQLIATVLYGKRDIILSPAFRRLEINPALDIRLEVEGVTPEELRAAGAPEQFASSLKAARAQFGIIVKELQARSSKPFTARLVVDRPYDLLKGRKLIGAMYENGTLTTMRVTRKAQDDESRQALVVIPKSFPRTHAEAYLVVGSHVSPITYDSRARYRVQVLTADVHAVNACDPERCFLVDAFIPAL